MARYSKKTHALNALTTSFNAMLEARFVGEDTFKSVCFDFNDESKEHEMQILFDKNDGTLGYIMVLFRTQDIDYIAHTAGKMLGSEETYLMLFMMYTSPTVKAMTLVL